jgi:hypothetical protein
MSTRRREGFGETIVYGLVVCFGALVLGNVAGPTLATASIHYDIPREVPLLFVVVSFRWLPAFIAVSAGSSLLYRRYCSHWALARRVLLCAVNIIVVAGTVFPIGIAVSNG